MNPTYSSSTSKQKLLFSAFSLPFVFCFITKLFELHGNPSISILGYLSLRIAFIGVILPAFLVLAYFIFIKRSTDKTISFKEPLLIIIITLLSFNILLSIMTLTSGYVDSIFFTIICVTTLASLFLYSLYTRNKLSFLILCALIIISVIFILVYSFSLRA